MGKSFKFFPGVSDSRLDKIVEGYKAIGFFHDFDRFLDIGKGEAKRSVVSVVKQVLGGIQADTQTIQAGAGQDLDCLRQAGVRIEVDGPSFCLFTDEVNSLFDNLGLKQRLALASDIIHEPSILFLDEATSGVDPISRRNFWDLIYAMAQEGRTILVTTHYMEEAEFCDRLVLIYQGRIIAQGTPSELKGEVKETILALTPDNLDGALDLIKKLPQVAEAAVFGDGLHIATIRPEETEPAIQSVLAAHHIACGRIEWVRPSLEDAFISLVQRADDNKAVSGQLSAVS